jgi:murein DD-endopeptidase MepM/ murein hydrolase activator NlpD
MGDDVAVGQPIGLSGDSGCSSGPHVHVALFRNRSNFDAGNTLPLNYNNATGPLDSRRGLVQDGSYTAGS